MFTAAGDAPLNPRDGARLVVVVYSLLYSVEMRLHVCRLVHITISLRGIAFYHHFSGCGPAGPVEGGGRRGGRSGGAVLLVASGC